MDNQEIKIIVGGRGNMATAMFDYGYSQREKGITPYKFPADDSDIAQFGSLIGSTKNTVAVYFGGKKGTPEEEAGGELARIRKEKMEKFCNFSSMRGIPIVVGSTGQDDLIPKGLKVPAFKTPNNAFPVISFLSQMRDVAKKYPGAIVEIMESHQSTKKSVPGTAKAIAEIFGIPESDIVSVRDKLVQRVLGIPEEHLNAHGYHWVRVVVAGVSFWYCCKINGRRAYAEGVVGFAEKVLEKRDMFQNVAYTLEGVQAIIGEL